MKITKGNVMSDKKLIDNLIPTSKSDISEIKELLSKIKIYYNDLASLYSIKDDIVEVTDKRRTLSKLLDTNINDFKQQSKDLTTKINEELKKAHNIRKKAEELLITHEQFNLEINGIATLLNETDTEGQQYQETLKELISPERILELKNKHEEISGFWSELFNTDDGAENKIVSTQAAYSELQKLHDDFIIANESGESKEDELNQLYDDIKKEHEKIVKGYTVIQDDKEVSVTPYAAQIKVQKDNLDDFYKKIYGTGEDHGLTHELDNRLAQLKEIEIEAKKVIGLSSDAGLAAGFSGRGKKASKNKYVSLFIFICIMMTLGLLNTYDPVTDTFSLKNVEDINDLNELLVKLIFNIPFIWIAIVANVNLNKYSRLEEEYAHKESLAKSFERYKEQIINLDDSKESQDLMLRLLTANISAFEKNAADTMDKAKADTLLKNALK